MAFEIVFSSIAEIQFTEAIEWYEKEKRGLGERFFYTVQDALDKIRDNPETYRERYHNIRMILTKKFKYCVYYEILEHEIRIHAVLHAKQDRSDILQKLILE